jgi:cytochrome c553
MNPILKWTGIVLASMAGLAVLAAVCVLVASQMILDRTYPKRQSTVHALVTAEAVTRGAHLAAVATCTGCHTKGLTGQRFDVPGSTFYAPNLTRLTQTFSDADFDNAIRQGVRPDGKSLLLMPSHVFTNFTDNEVASIIAYLRSFKPRGDVSPDRSLGLIVRAAFVAGKFQTEADEFSAVKPSLDMGPRYWHGRHLAGVICAQCHGTNLAGEPKNTLMPTPDLTIVAAYDRGDFHTLMRTGKAAGGREVGVMSQAARQHFSNFTNDEIDAIYDYLSARGRALTSSPDKPRGQ